MHHYVDCNIGNETSCKGMLYSAIFIPGNCFNCILRSPTSEIFMKKFNIRLFIISFYYYFFLGLGHRKKFLQDELNYIELEYAYLCSSSFLP